MVRGFARFVPCLFLGLLRAPTRNSPERVRDTICTSPEKSGKPRGLEPPGLSGSEKGVFWKRGLSRKVHFLEKLEILESLENRQTLENKGESDHFLEILENLEILEILEIPPVKRPLS